MNPYSYQYLPARLQKLYREFSGAIGNGSNRITLLSHTDVDDIMRVLSRALLDEPETFWMSCEVSVRTGLLNEMVEIHELPLSPGIIQRMRLALSKEARKILSREELSACKADARRLQFIYRYIQENTRYDYDGMKTNRNPLSHTAYGALVNGLSVCDGNAKAAILLCQQLGIPCIGIDGSLRNCPHSWLLVNVNSVWYHMDPTYCYMIDDELDASHWLQSDSEMQTEYRWDRTAYPVCDRKNSYIESKRSEENTSLEKITNALEIESMTAYQSVLRKSLRSLDGKLGLVFTGSFGPVRPEQLKKVFERVASDICASEICYTFEFDQENRYLSFRWEEA